MHCKSFRKSEVWTDEAVDLKRKTWSFIFIPSLFMLKVHLKSVNTTSSVLFCVWQPYKKSPGLRNENKTSFRNLTYLSAFNKGSCQRNPSILTVFYQAFIIHKQKLSLSSHSVIQISTLHFSTELFKREIENLIIFRLYYRRISGLHHCEFQYFSSIFGGKEIGKNFASSKFSEILAAVALE